MYVQANTVSLDRNESIPLTQKLAVRHSDKLTRPLYAKRDTLTSRIPHFWALVFENCPPEIDQYISPSDSQFFADSLTNLEVERFDVHNNPRSFLVRMTFDASNEWFENETLEKKFWFRRSSDGWSGLVSEPVAIRWKKGKDITNGLLGKAAKLFEAQHTTASSATNGAGKKAPAKLKEYDALLKALESTTDGEMSFFTWFGFVSSHRYVSAEEDVEAVKKEKENRAKKAAGEDVPEDADEDDGDLSHDNLEIFPNGDELATLIAEDLWPQALKYFISVQEMDDEDMEEIDEDDNDAEDDESDGEIDIRALVQGKGKKGKEGSPPAKKRKA